MTVVFLLLLKSLMIFFFRESVISEYIDYLLLPLFSLSKIIYYSFIYGMYYVLNTSFINFYVDYYSYSINVEY